MRAPKTSAVPEFFWKYKMSELKTNDDASAESVVNEIYQGEVFGEGFSTQLLSYFSDPVAQYKLGSILQLETETKARLRPIIAANGWSIVEQTEQRLEGAEMAKNFEGMDWPTVMQALAEPAKDSAAQYHALADGLPAELKDFGDFMRAHEQAIADFFGNEAAGDFNNAIDEIVGMLNNPLPRPAEMSA